MALYDGLQRRLARERSAEVVLTFQQIEAAMGSPLSKSACFSHFWDNPHNRQYNHGVKQAVQQAGFRATLMADKSSVRFTRL